MGKLKLLNLGCGKDIKRGYVNADLVKLPGVDKVVNLEKYPWPFKDNEFDGIYCDNVLEHLSSITKPAEELWRITKKSGKIIVKVPIYPSIWTFTDPTHKSAYTYITYDYFRPHDGLNYYSKARFHIAKKRIIFSPLLPFMTFLINLHPKIQKLYFLFFSFLCPATSLYFELVPLKEKK